jgi:RNA polymerase sigma factor (sigma-70 family)
MLPVYPSITAGAHPGTNTMSTPNGHALSDDGRRAAPPDADPSPATRALVEHHRTFLDFVQRRVGDRAVAEEILQEAFVRSLERGDTLRDGESAVAWCYRVLRNALADHFRRRAAESRAVEAYGREPAGEVPGPDAELMATVCACVTGLVETLKDTYAEALRAVDLQGQSLQAYAEREGILPNNAAVRLHRARQSLRKQLMRCCGTCATHGCVDCACGT